MDAFSKLDQLRKVTTVVADTGDIDAIRRLHPIDCTTNPTLVLKAVELPSHADTVAEALAWGKRQAGDRAAVVKTVADRLAVAIGAALTPLVPGRVSIEVDADLSFDTAATIAKARQIIAAYDARGIDRDRFLIKIAATWEGIRAAEVLQRDGIDCNLTLIFSQAQAVACADAKVFLISPFVGRILDWYVKAEGRTFTLAEHPGVLAVRRMYEYFKSYGIKTEVMAASLRSIGEVEALAGCDRMTIPPAVLEALSDDKGGLERQLSPVKPAVPPTPLHFDEATFRWAQNEDAMATEKLADGIRIFAKDLGKMRALIDGWLP